MIHTWSATDYETMSDGRYLSSGTRPEPRWDTFNLLGLVCRKDG